MSFKTISTTFRTALDEEIDAQEGGNKGKMLRDAKSEVFGSIWTFRDRFCEFFSNSIRSSLPCSIVVEHLACSFKMLLFATDMDLENFQYISL